jgi:hypothetical protein
LSPSNTPGINYSRKMHAMTCHYFPTLLTSQQISTAIE